MTTALIERELRRHHFAVLSTTAPDGAVDSAGVSYGVSEEDSSPAVFVMTRRHLRKARDIAVDPRVSLVVPLERRVLWFVPPATIQAHGRAEILDWTDAAGTAVFERFWLGRRILAAYRASHERGERRICFLRIVLDPLVRSYMVGTHLWEIGGRMEDAAATVTFARSRTS